MTPPDINIKRHTESQRDVQMNVSLKRSCHFSFLFFYLNCNIYLRMFAANISELPVFLLLNISKTVANILYLDTY